jgi:hypothetical protein
MNNKIKYANGDIYIGDIKNKKRHGEGKMSYSKKSEYLEYDGNWQEDFQHGNGTLLYKNGARYVGSFLRSTKHGIGILTLSNGD